MTTREEKLEALKQLMAGRISPDQLPKPDPENYLWHFGGTAYTRLLPHPYRPHPSGLKLTPDGFAKFAAEDLTRMHVIIDTTGDIEPGNLQREVLVDDDYNKDELPKEKVIQVSIIRVGATMPLGSMLPVKASQWKQLGT